ncbi:unnamed protein product [Cylindrotheca closterium]|uniref:DDE Tnp4 domain-containing protein n=1 Tax=Cylindrotheca closterium TaxID=2856 RepID=A0AAD2JMT6_9STRA|nr:unnamed protein product [Cylindrotheca closterium]
MIPQALQVTKWISLSAPRIPYSILRYIYFTVAAPGSTGDARAVARCENLVEWINNLPNEAFVGGDNAYQLSDSLVIPFSGAERYEELKRTFNFYLSQLRIRIEMSFGRLSTKWRIFRTKLSFKMDKNIKIIQVASRLHNFVIDQQEIEKIQLQGTESMAQLRTIAAIDRLEGYDKFIGDNLGYLPSERPARLRPRMKDTHVSQNESSDSQNESSESNQSDEESTDEMSVDFETASKRQSILELVEELRLVRPDRNRERNN